MQQLSAQLSFDELSALHSDDETTEQPYAMFRITAIHRDRIQAIGELGRSYLTSTDLLCPPEFRPTSQFLAVGDWIMAERVEEHWRIKLIVEPKSRLQRLSGDRPQLIAANLDYLWIVTSANQDFNLKRLQRYLALALEADIEPVVILTKSDLCSEVELEEYLAQLQQLNCKLIHAISSLEGTGLDSLKPYLHSGISIALVGSSGVGKSSLLNALAGTQQEVAGIREDDGKGKHTTTARQLFFIASADEKNHGKVAVIDTPGMRELQLFNSQQGIEETFADIHSLAQRCRFGDCRHEQEPGCKVREALEKGSVDPSDFINYQKLLKEDEYAKRRELGSHAEREHQRSFSKMVKAKTKERW
ncbi:ribosome small subunit-dependent GTPase A [Litoribrevibacter euphylliae]|uniref:Small ribosomal subunit biogenesis GTPase RsgA n=1 Tax=Litoribrevibacter euphylliae TaxID=1834034 RepID=A0ABV7HEX4_9GAMM